MSYSWNMGGGCWGESFVCGILEFSSWFKRLQDTKRCVESIYKIHKFKRYLFSYWVNNIKYYVLLPKVNTVGGFQVGFKIFCKFGLFSILLSIISQLFHFIPSPKFIYIFLFRKMRLIYNNSSYMYFKLGMHGSLQEVPQWPASTWPRGNGIRIAHLTKSMLLS